MEYSFPQYRKYVNRTTHFKILSEKQFEEISFVGKKGFLETINATQYPEYLRIQDMLACKDGIWEETTEKDFEQQKSLV